MSWGETLFLKKFIQGEKRLVANNSSIIKDGAEITPKLNGTLCFVLEITKTSTGTIQGIPYTIYENNIKYKQGSYNIEGSGTIYKYIYFDVVKGNTYGIYSNPSGATIRNIAVGGQVTDYNYIE